MVRAAKDMVRAAIFMTGLLSFTVPASAETCASERIMGRSEPSRYEWTAKAKARANWRSKVRALPGLGPDYSTWSRAINTEERCITGPSGSLCTFTGTPCSK